MRPIRIDVFHPPTEGQPALEGWLVYVTNHGEKILVERVLIQSDGRVFDGLIAPRTAKMIRLDVSIDESPGDGFYIHAVPVRLARVAGLWTSHLDGDGHFLMPFKGEAIALLEKDRWFVPWSVLLCQVGQDRPIAA